MAVVWLASFPRSGNTFVRILLKELYGQEALSLYEDDPSAVDPGSLADLRKDPRLYFIKTHEAPDDDSPAILLTRDGRDAMVSYAHFIEDYGLLKPSPIGRAVSACRSKIEERLLGRPPFEQLLRRVVDRRYHDWSAHFMAWDLRGAPTAHLRFETLIDNPLRSLEQSIAALGLALPPLPPQAKPPCFGCLRQRDPRFFRAGRVGQWREEMSPELQDIFWREHGPAMLAAGYER